MHRVVLNEMKEEFIIFVCLLELIRLVPQTHIFIQLYNKKSITQGDNNFFSFTDRTVFGFY